VARSWLAAALILGVLPLSGIAATAAVETGYIGRPIYSEPAIGLQLPPTCIVEPTWREPLSGIDFEVWIANCDGAARVWLLKRQVVEVLDSRESRLRFQVFDERVLPDEKAGDTLSVQCTSTDNQPAVVVRGARWRSDGRELHLAGASGAMHADIAQHRLVEMSPAAIDCTRFPDREAMMRKLQQSEHPRR
jgi:hypothetical protein